MKRMFLGLLAAIMSVTVTFAQEDSSSKIPTMKFGILIDNYSNLVESDGSNITSSQKMHNAATLSLNSEKFGANIEFNAINWFLADAYAGSGFNISDGDEYTTSPLKYLDNMYAWTKVLDDRVTFFAGKGGPDFCINSFYHATGTSNGFINSDVAGFAVIAKPIENLELAVSIPLNSGTVDISNAYKFTSGAARYKLDGIGSTSFQFYHSEDNFGLSLGNEITAIKDIYAFVSYEFRKNFESKADNWNNFETGVRYSGISGLTVSIEGELDIFTANAGTESYINSTSGNLAFTGGADIQAEFSISNSLRAGILCSYVYGESETQQYDGPPFFPGINGYTISPYIDILPNQAPPFTKINVAFNLYIPTDGNSITWSIPLMFRFLAV